MKEQALDQLNSFIFEGRDHKVSFVETISVTTGVECDVYIFVGDSTKDLGIIRIQPGCKTPLQKVLNGEKTIEGFASGRGKLEITKSDGDKWSYPVGGVQNSLKVSVAVGDLMQWEADVNSNLVAYEICLPPYKDGRFENLE